MKRHVVLFFFLCFFKKRNFFQKSIDKPFLMCYNSCRNKEKFRFHPVAKLTVVNSFSSRISRESYLRGA
jgi:hypothetical protein